MQSKAVRFSRNVNIKSGYRERNGSAHRPRGEGDDARPSAVHPVGKRLLCPVNGDRGYSFAAHADRHVAGLRSRRIHHERHIDRPVLLYFG